MNIYMLQDAKSGLFYRRRRNYSKWWVVQQDASIWTNRRGPGSIMNSARMKNAEPVIRTFRLEEINE